MDPIIKILLFAPLTLWALDMIRRGFYMVRDGKKLLFIDEWLQLAVTRIFAGETVAKQKTEELFSAKRIRQRGLWGVFLGILGSIIGVMTLIMF